MDNTVGTIGSLCLGVNNKAVRSLRNSLSLSQIQKSLIYGTMMGDGCIYGNAGEKQKNYRLQIIQTAKQKELVWWKFQLLRNFVLKEPQYLNANNSWRFRTISHPEITEIYHRFYRNGKKIVPKNIKEIIRDRLALAVWYMDDGCKDTSYGQEKGLIINTQNFSVDEQQKLIELLEKIHGIKARINKDRKWYRLHIGVRFQYKFSQLVKDYIIDILKYKLPKDP